MNEIAITLENCATRIEAGARTTIDGIMQAGKALSEARQLFGENDKAYGQWREKRLPWMKNDTASRWLGVWNKFGQNLLPQNAGVDLAPSVLYLLAAPSTPEAVITKATEKAESGEKVTVADVKKWKDQAAFLSSRNEALQKQLAEAQEKPPVEIVKEVVREVVPQDYTQAKKQVETLRVELEKNKERLAKLKGEQAAAIERGVKDQMSFRQKEIAQLETSRANLEARVKELRDFNNRHNDSIATLQYHEQIRKKVHDALSDLSFDLVEFDFLDDRGNLDKWESLAIALEQASQAVRAVAIHAHKPAMNSWNEEEKHETTQKTEDEF